MKPTGGIKRLLFLRMFQGFGELLLTNLKRLLKFFDILTTLGVLEVLQGSNSHLEKIHRCLEVRPRVDSVLLSIHIRRGCLVVTLAA